MTKNNNHLAKELCLGCITGIYSAIVLFALVVSLFFQSSFDGTSVLSGYGIAIVIGGFIGLVSAYVVFRVKGK